MRHPGGRVEVTAEVVFVGPPLATGGAVPDVSPGSAEPAGRSASSGSYEGKIVAVPFIPTLPGGTPVDLSHTYETLVRDGAVAVLWVTPEPTDGFIRSHPMFARIGSLRGRSPVDGTTAPVSLLLGRGPTEALFGARLGALFSRMAQGAVVEPLDEEVSISIELVDAGTAPSYNVIGVVRGSDPSLRDEAVVLTAHYDAYGVVDDERFPGAADNALGTAELIALAGAVAKADVAPRRSLIFAAVGAEELGLLGSIYWVEEPTWPMDRVVANLNLDGGDAEAWGPLHGVLDLVPGASDLGSFAAAAATGLPLIPNPGPSSGFGGSDFIPFLRAGVPAIQLFGLGGDPEEATLRYRRYQTQRSHLPGDVIDPDWDWRGPAEMARLYLQTAVIIANATDRELPRSW